MGYVITGLVATMMGFGLGACYADDLKKEIDSNLIDLQNQINKITQNRRGSDE